MFADAFNILIQRICLIFSVEWMGFKRLFILVHKTNGMFCRDVIPIFHDTNHVVAVMMWKVQERMKDGKLRLNVILLCANSGNMCKLFTKKGVSIVRTLCDLLFQ